MTLLTTKQAAAILELSPGYVKALINMHRLPAIKPGHDFLIEKKDVMAYKKKREQQLQGT